MTTYTHCAICGKSIVEESFLKRSFEEPDAGAPVYWANKQFHPELSENIIFCSAAHSLEWYEQQQKKLKSDQQTNTI